LKRVVSGGQFRAGLRLGTLEWMCKRLVIPEQEDAEQEIAIAQPWWKFTVRFNVAVQQRVPVARLHNKMTEGVMMRWGFVPPPERQQHEDITVGAALVPSDKVLASEDYRRAWLYGQRCVIPLAGFYVWHLAADGVSRPSYVRLVNRAVFGVAGLWERTVLDEGEDVIESCALLTVPANRLIAEIDDDRQMPAILRREDYEEWLTSTTSKAQSLLRTYPLERMVTHPVGPRVNYLEFDDPELIRPAM
jgi:putative SOS response-associated peptidase YedK